MSEFFTSIGNWFLENFESITLWVQSTNIVAVVGIIVSVIKQWAATRTNTANLNSSNEVVNNNTNAVNSMKNDISELKTENASLKAENEELNTKTSEVLSGNDQILNKLNAMLEVYSLVYATIKNDDTRVAVNNILANAKMAETATREELLKQVESLQAQVAELTANTTAKVAAVVEQSKQILSGTTTTATTTTSTEVVTPRG